MANVNVVNLNFNYPNKTIFKGAHFSFKKGTINRIEGSNGVGKTTLFHILSNNIHSDVIVSPSQCFEFLTTEFLPFDELTGKELLLLFFKLNKVEIKRFNNYIKIFKDLDLEFIMKTKYKNMSLGEKQKLNIIVSFIDEKKIVLLDEPFNGLDKQSKIILGHILLVLSQKYHRTILYISHNDIELEVNKRFIISNEAILEMETSDDN